MKYRHHKYTWCKPFGNARHTWELAGPLGAVHFHVAENKEYGDSAGLEFHHTEACGYRADEAPDHISCPLTGGRCWHDGTSLYASETLWPMVKGWMRAGDHDAIFRLLEGEADARFKGFEIARRSIARAAGITDGPREG